MSEDDPREVFNLDRLRDLARLMIEHDLTEVDLRQHGETIRLRRGGETVQTTHPATAVVAAAAPPTASAAVPDAAASQDDDSDVVIFKSPMVGTFYSRPSPDAEPFVKVGQEITADTTICIIEAMKVFNEIPAEIAGKVVAVLVDNEEPVEYGKPLLKIRPLR